LTISQGSFGDLVIVARYSDLFTKIQFVVESPGGIAWECENRTLDENNADYIKTGTLPYTAKIVSESMLTPTSMTVMEGVLDEGYSVTLESNYGIFEILNWELVVGDITVYVVLPEQKGCFTPESLVYLSDGSTKEIQYVTYSDEILCWDFYNGGYKFQKPVLFYECINKNEGNTTKLFFSDNTSISIFAHHKLLNAETLEWVTIRSSNVEQFVGQSFIKIDDRNNNTCKAVELTGYEISTQDIIGYSLLIAEYLNCVVDDFFSLEVPLGYEELFIIFDIEENMRYDSDKIEEDIANYGLFTYDDFKDYVSESQFYALCGHYMKIPVAKGLSTPEDMMKLALSYFS